MLLVHGLEHLRDDVGIAQRYCPFIAVRIFGGDLFAIDRRRAVLRDEIEQARHSNVGLGGNGEEGNE